MLSLEVRKRSGGAEVHRVNDGTVTLGASSGNEIVVRARGVAGRHLRISHREGGGYSLELYKGAEAVIRNGEQFQGGPIAPGDRIRIGEATITVLVVREEAPSAPEASPAPQQASLPPTEVEYRSLRLAAYRLARGAPSPDVFASELTDFLDRELPPTEWAVGEVSSAGFRPLASTFRERPAVPPRLLEEIRAGETLARLESVAGVLTLVCEPGSDSSGRFAILVRESPRLPARAALFLEELASLAGVTVGAPATPRNEPAVEDPSSEESSSSSAGEWVLRQTDDLKRIVETVEREVIDRAMRRVQGNQSRGSQVLNISRGSLIAKLKEYGIRDYRYLRRERKKRT